MQDLAAPSNPSPVKTAKSSTVATTGTLLPPPSSLLPPPSSLLPPPSSLLPPPSSLLPPPSSLLPPPSSLLPPLSSLLPPPPPSSCPVALLFFSYSFNLPSFLIFIAQAAKPASAPTRPASSLATTTAPPVAHSSYTSADTDDLDALMASLNSTSARYGTISQCESRVLVWGEDRDERFLFAAFLFIVG